MAKVTLTKFEINAIADLLEEYPVDTEFTIKQSNKSGIGITTKVIIYTKDKCGRKVKKSYDLTDYMKW